MKNRFGSNKHVNFGIALALFGILVFSLATSVEGFGLKEGITAPAKDKSKDTKGAKPSAKGKDAIKKALHTLQQSQSQSHKD